MFGVALKSFRAFLRNLTTLFFTVLFPSVCVFFLGTFLENIEVSDYAVGEVSVLYAEENTDPLSAAAFGEFLENLENVAAWKTSAEEVKSFDRETYSAGILLNGEDLTLYYGEDWVVNRTVRMILDSYQQTASAYRTVAASDPAALSGIVLSEESYVRRGDFGANRSMMDYYAVTMLVMIVFMGSVIAGTSEYTDECIYCTMDRLRISAVSGLRIYFGKILGNLPMIVVQIASVMLSASLLFGARYCADLPLNLLLIGMLLSVSVAALSAGLFLNLLFPKIPSYQIIMPVFWTMMFVSGTFAKDIHIPGVSEIMPVYLVQNAAFDLTVFSRTEKAAAVTAVSLVVFAVTLALSALKLSLENRRMGRRSA